MTREMLRLVKESKQRAAELIKYASPKNGRNMKNCPTNDRVMEILLRSIPYCGEKPVVTNFGVTEYHKNNLIKVARFRVETADGKAFEISAYQHLKGRTPEQKEADKNATFPSGLFNIFHKEIP